MTGFFDNLGRAASHQDAALLCMRTRAYCSSSKLNTSVNSATVSIMPMTMK